MIDGYINEDDFNSCLNLIPIHLVELLGIDDCDSISAKTVVIMPDPIPELLVLCQLEATTEKRRHLLSVRPRRLRIHGQYSQGFVASVCVLPPPRYKDLLVGCR